MAISGWTEWKLALSVGMAGVAVTMFTPPAVADGHGEDATACFLPATELEDGTMADQPGPDALEAGYQCLEETLIAGYAQSKHVLAQLFSSWDRIDHAPFQYEETGARYLVTYANDRATGEEPTLWLDRTLPIGAVVALPSFTVADDGRVTAGPLMLMEKMPNGYPTFGRGNWRQTLIGPDGEILGVTNGPPTEELTACDDCGARSNDRMYLAMLNDGVVPPDAPQASLPFSDSSGDGGAPPAADALDPGALLGTPEAPLDPLAPPAAPSFDPNASLGGAAPLDPLAPLAPAPATPGVTPLADPLAPLAPAPIDPSSPAADPLAPLAPAPSAPLADPLAPLAPATPSTGLDPLDPNAPLDPLLPPSTSSLDDADASVTEQANNTAAEAIDSLNPPDITSADSGLSEFALELADATDPLLPLPDVPVAEPPPFLEADGFTEAGES